MEETPEAIQSRHRKELRDLQSRTTSKKKNATKKTRKGINDECAALERDMKERHERELAVVAGDGGGEPGADDGDGAVAPGDADTAGITDRLKDATISSDTPTATTTSASTPAPSSQPPSQAPVRSPAESQGQGGGGGGGKKRNRQKERLARRAAEQEADAEAAEKEAHGMTDYRSLERTSLERAFSANGLVEHEIRPDGHCLFSAIADQLSQRGIPVALPTSRGGGKDQPSYRVVRRVATDYMERHADDFAPFLEEPLESYVPKIRDTAEWGGQLELLALASAYQVEIKVVQNGRIETIQPSGAQGEKENERPTVWLAYYRHGFGLGEHYNSLRTKS